MTYTVGTAVTPLEEEEVTWLRVLDVVGIDGENLNNNAYYTSRYVGAGRLPEVKEHWKGVPMAPESLD